jgi:hypothetical protein
MDFEMSTFSPSSHATRGATVASDSDRAHGESKRALRTQSRPEVDAAESRTQVVFKKLNYLLGWVLHLYVF